ncbi:MAG: hypothetical protein KIH69_003535 [Anaerolineae bacterium]|nr:hypothetical protein [Anaerolineae bacterium]
MQTAWHAMFPHSTLPVQCRTEPLADILAAEIGQSAPNDIICVTGSLHLVAEAEDVLGRVIQTTG